MKNFIISFEYGGFRADHYKIYNENMDLYINENGDEFSYKISEEEWSKFWIVIDEIDAWKWGRDYFDQGVLDGIQWELVIDREGKKRRRIFGSNDYPNNFSLLLDAINTLAGTDLVHDEED